MKIRKVRKDALDLFVAVLPRFGEVYAPVRRGDGWAFAPPRRWSEVDLHYTRTRLPPKKILLPPHERLLRFRPLPTIDGFLQVSPRCCFLLV